MKRVCVFCGSRTGTDPVYGQVAHALGEELTRRHLELVYGGGNVGLMGILADAVMQAGGQAIGVIPQALLDKEVAHQQLTALHVVDSMHQRKALMAEMADAFVALPGGMGTLEELFEILTWAQLGLHAKPCAVLNTANYYAPLLAFLDHAVTENFVKPRHRQRVLVATEPSELLDLLNQAHPPAEPQTLEPRQT